MSTRSRIAIKHENGIYTSVYCHNASSELGNILNTAYPTLADAKELIELGDLSYVNPDKVFAYHRDRGEPWERTHPKYSRNWEAFAELANASNADVVFIFENSQWTTIKKYNY